MQRSKQHLAFKHNADINDEISTKFSKLSAGESSRESNPNRLSIRDFVCYTHLLRASHLSNVQTYENGEQDEYLKAKYILK